MRLQLQLRVKSLTFVSLPFEAFESEMGAYLQRLVHTLSPCMVDPDRDPSGHLHRRAEVWVSALYMYQLVATSLRRSGASCGRLSSGPSENRCCGVCLTLRHVVRFSQPL